MWYETLIKWTTDSISIELAKLLHFYCWKYINLANKTKDVRKLKSFFLKLLFCLWKMLSFYQRKHTSLMTFLKLKNQTTNLKSMFKGQIRVSIIACWISYCYCVSATANNTQKLIIFLFPLALKCPKLKKIKYRSMTVFRIMI